MTAQISDTVLYQNRLFDIAGIHGSGLFNPLKHDLEPRMLGTSCWRGYYCHYEISDNQLVLNTVHIGLDRQQAELAEHGTGPQLFGQTPQKGYRGWEYSDLNTLIPFTGGLLIGHHFMQELYVHMGFHPAWKFREVHELTLENGHLLEAVDRSEEMEKIRSQIKPGVLEPRLDESDSKLISRLKRNYLP